MGPNIKKKYTLASLSTWFKAYKKSWWTHYAASLDEKQGFKFLQQAAVYSVIVEKTFLLVYGHYEKHNYYATCELDPKGTLKFQISGNHTELGKGFWAAGLLTLEQILEENLNKLCALSEDKGAPGPASLGTRPNAPTLLQPKNENTRGQLKFYKSRQALAFELYFPRLQGFWKMDSMDHHLNLRERESLLGLLHSTQKYGFRWVKNHFQSTSPEAFSDFISIEIPKLSQHYFIELSDAVQRLADGEQSVQITLSARNNNLLDTSFSIGRTHLTSEEIQQITGTKGDFYWSETHGLIHWKAEDVTWLKRLNDWKKRLDGKLPAYLSLSSFYTSHLDKKTLDWANNLSSISTELPFTPSVPLRDYQLKGVIWLRQLLNLGCHPLLADEMGLGKTRQILSLLEWIRKESPKSDPDLILCPASVLSSWQNEQQNCFPFLDLEILSKNRLLDPEIPPAGDIFVISYGQLRSCARTLKKMRFRCVIADEAQYMKNPKSKTAHACFNLKAQFRIATTGTPLENNPTDLWTIFHFLMPGILGDYKEFQDLLQTDDAFKTLKVQIAPFVLRRTKQEVLKELPAKEEHTIYCPMTPKQQALYNEWRNKSQQLKQGEWSQLFTLLLRLRQICCDPGLLVEYNSLPYTESGKLLWLEQQLEVCAKAHKKIIIFSQFRHLLTRLQPLVSKFYPQNLLLTGDTPVYQRRELIDKFQNNKDTAFLISLKAGGVGITLHSANVVFLMDPWWNPTIEKQAIARAHRLGQQWPLQVYRLLVDHSIESKVQALQKHKGDLFEQLFEKDCQLSPTERWQQLYELLSSSSASS